MLTTRARLVPYWYAAKGKWYPRGSWTEKDASGNLVRRRSTKGSGTDTRGACQVQCDALNVRLEAALDEGPHVPSFAEAAAVYIELGHEARFLHDRLLDVIGHVRCDEIDNATMVKAANTVYSGCAAVTINRQLYTPVVAVLSFAAQDQHWRPQKLKRPKGYAKLAPAKSPQTAWFERVLPECRLQLKALLLFITLTSRRVGEAIKLKPADFDPGEGTVLIQRDKAGNPVFIRLAPEVIEAISAYRWQDGRGLFGSYTPVEPAQRVPRPAVRLQARRGRLLHPAQGRTACLRQAALERRQVTRPRQGRGRLGEHPRRRRIVWGVC